MIPLTLPEPGKSQPRHFTWLCVAICFLGAALIAQKIQKFSGTWDALSPVAAAKSVTLSVGPAVFQLSRDLISPDHQRLKRLPDGARVNALRLAIEWPALTPSSGLFATSGKDLVLIDLDSNPGRESLRARLEPFYRRLARGGELSGPDGLKILALSPRSEPVTDLVAYDPARKDGFIARCRVEPASDSAICHRARRLEAGLELRYRFDQSLLRDWRQLDKAIVQRVEKLRVKSR